MRKNGGVLERFLKSLLVAIFAAVVAFAPAYADDACKNLFDINQMTRKNGTVDLVVSGDSITIPGNAGASAYSFLDYFIPAGTYTISYNVTSSVLMYAIFGYADNTTIRINDGPITTNQSNIAGTLGTSNGGYRQISTASSTVIVSDGPFKLGFAPTSTVTLNNIQLERGSTATAYQPYNPLCATCDGTVVSYESVVAADVPAGVQNGTPTPTNPIEPVFYKQGDMVLRRIGDYADSYDATTGKITRRIGVKVLKGTAGESWGRGSYTGGYRFWLALCDAPLSQYIYSMMPQYKGVLYQTPEANVNYSVFIAGVTGSCYGIFVRNDDYSTASAFKSYLAEQYANNTPVVVYYPLKEANWYTENWPSSYCHHPIKIATTKYSDAQFTPVVNALNTAVDTIKTVVANTITQTAAIAQIASDKQTRPDSACPAGKKCLLIEDANGDPHWYEIIEEYIPPE